METAPKTLIETIFENHGIVAAYDVCGHIFYDTKNVFERHNFGRNVRRLLEDKDFVIADTKYYPSAKGIMILAVNIRNAPLLDALLEALQTVPAPLTYEPLPPPPPPPSSPPSPPPPPTTPSTTVFEPAPYRPTTFSFVDPQSTSYTPFLPSFVGPQTLYAQQQPFMFYYPSAQHEQPWPLYQLPQ